MRRKFLLMTFLIAIIGFCGTNLSAENTGVAKVGNTEYATIDEAIAAWTNGTTLTLLADVTLSDVIQLSSTEYHILDLGSYTMTAASKKDAIQIVNNGRSSASYALDIKADATNPGGITATGKAVVRTTGKSGVKDRPIIRFYNGVFNSSYIVYHSGSNGTNCPQFQFHGGVFNGTIYTNRTLNQFYGGIFNGSLMMSVDSSAYTLIAGGTFKQLSNLYMSALNSSKFTIGSAKGVYDKEVYIDDNGNYVIAANEPQGIEADVAKTPGTNDYLAYSKVATEGQLGYTDVYTAINNNKSGTITVYKEELDLNNTGFTGTIVVPADRTITITNAPEGLKVTDVEGNTITPNANGTYTTVEPAGNNFTGYTGEDAIWGEVWGNAYESFVIKVLDANGNVMGTTSLNNIGGIIDGDVNVTWNLKLDAANNTDEYWTMSWETAPSIANMPAKVELWVDGVKVSGGDVVLNGPDNLNMIYAAVTDANGKILSYHTSIANAVAAITNTRSNPQGYIALLRNTDEAITLPAGIELKLNGFEANNIVIPVASVNGTSYTDLQDAIVAAAPAGTVEILADVVVDEWIMFSETLNISSGQIITMNIDGLTINGNGKTVTIKSIESAGNGGYLIFDATNLNVKDLTINYADGLVGGIGLTNGTISNVTFIGGTYGVFPGAGNVTVTGCTFETNGTAIYFEQERDDLVVTGNTFKLSDETNVILLRGDVEFTGNTVVSGRTVNVVSGSPVVTGNYFNEVRFKVYNAATATIENNEINVLAFNDDSVVCSTFGVNTLSEEAQAVLDAASFPVAQIGTTKYAKLEDAFKAATSGSVIEILSDVTVDYAWDCRNTGSKFTVPVTINGNDKTIKFTGAIDDKNWNTVFRFEEEATVNNLTVNIEGATTVQRVITAKKSLNVDDLTIVGSSKYGIIFGEGASAEDLAATEIVIKNSALNGTGRAVSDNEGGKDVKSVVIEGNNLTANVYVSASESIVFNNNTTTSEVDLRSYAADNVLSVEAKDNELNEEVKNYIYAKNIDAQEEFTTENPPLKVANIAELNAAIAAAKEGNVITLTADIDYSTDQLKIEKAITLDLGGKTLTTRNAYGGMSIKNNPTIKNGNIVHASNTAAIKVWNATAFEDLVIDVQGKGDANKTIGGIVLQSGSTTRVGSIKNVTIKGDALTNGIETYNCGDATENVIGSMEDVNIDAVGTAMLISALCGTATNCTFDGGVNGIEIWIKGNYSASLELVGCDVVGGVFAHDEFSSNPEIENNGTLNLTADEDTEGAGVDDVTLTLARAENVDGVLEDVMVQAKAKVNNTYYQTLAKAVVAVQEGQTIQLLAGEISEGTIKLPATLKNVTFKGAADHASVLKDMTIMAADGNSFNYEGLTFDGIYFNNSRISLTGWRNGDETIKDLTVTNCWFKNLDDTSNSAPLHINKDASEAVNGLTFTNNVIDGATGGDKSGVYAQTTGVVVFTGNIINNVSFRPYIIQLTTDDGVADNFTVTGNKFSGSAAGRAQGLGNNAEGTDAVSLTISNNIFEDITNAQQICYWNFNEAKTTAVLEKNYYDIDIEENPNRIYFNSAAQDAYDLLDMGIFPIYKELNADGTINTESEYTPNIPFAQIGETGYPSLEAAAAAAQPGDEILLLANVTLSEELTTPAGITLNGNGKQINGSIVAGGDLTIKGHTKATSFNAGYNQPIITIGAGACLEMNGADRMVIGHGATFNITGNITDAKNANVADLTPSLIMPGASFTGAGVTFNVTNAYINAPSSYCSSSKSASGTFVFKFDNSIWESAGKLAFESQSTAATVNFELKDSKLTTGSHLVFGVSRGEVVFDNSNVNVGTSRQIENQSTMTVKNGSVVNGAVATSSNAKNPGTLIVDNATYAVTGEFSGSDLGTGTLIVNKTANFSATSITKANIQIDATGMIVGDVVNITANLNNHTGTIEVINDNMLDAKIDDGKIVIVERTLQGEGTEASPYVINNLEDLKFFRDDVNAGNNYAGKYIKVTATEIDLNNEEWTPIAYMGKTFKGNFDGNNVTVKNLKITKALTNSAENNGIGFFGRTDSPATIENIIIENVDITGSLYVGAIVGYGYTGKHVEDCTVKGNIAIDAWWYAGVIGGNGYMNLVDDCHVIGNNGSYIKGNDGSYIGGIWGFRGEGNNKITNCTVTNLNIIGVDRVGGICGIGHYGNTISGCDAEDVTVTATDPDATTIGLLVGATQGNDISGQGPTIFEDNDASGITAQIDNGDGTYTEVTNLYGTNINGSTPVTNYVAQIVGGTQYATLAEAVAAAVNNDVITLLPTNAPIAMNASLYGKNVTITGTATVDWSKGFLFVGRGGEGNAKLTFESANLTSASNSSSYGIHVSGREKNTNNKYDGTVNINNSTIELDYLINKGNVTLDNSTLTVKNGFAVGGRPASETESGADATATMTLNNNSRVVVNNHNGMGLGYEAIGVMDINSGSTFECTQSFLVTAKGTMNVNGGNVKVDGTLTNNGAVNVNEGENTLNITTLEGKEIKLQHGATLVDTNVGGEAMLYGAVTFKGDNTFTMIYDYGAAYSTESAAWTVEPGASLTLTATVRYGLGYGDNATIKGNITDALTARGTLTDDDLSFFTHGISMMCNWNEENYLTVNDAYVQIGSNNSFGTKNDYGQKGKFYVNFTNSVLTSSRVTIVENGGFAYFTFNGSDVLTGGWSQKHAGSTAEFTNSKMVVTGNGTDYNNANAGMMTIVGSNIEFESGAFTNTGTLNIGEKSTFTAPTVINNGTINFTAPSAKLVAQEGLAINLALDNPEYYEIEYADGAYSVKQVIFEQTQTLSSGWNWFSSYINLNSNEGLETLQNALGKNGIEIKSHNSGYVRYDNTYEFWWGSLSAVAADQMYMIRTSTQVDDMKLVGEMVDYNNVSITLKPGWNWIGFPMSEDVSVTDALAGFEAKPGDQIKSKVSGNASYDADIWYGGLNTLVPGEGYMYYNSSSEARSFTYNVGTGTRGELKANVTTDGNHWIPNAGQYPNNMTMTAMVEVEGGDYEVAAFVNGECRGSARPIYIEAMDAHILFLTIHGEDVEEMTFRYYDIATGEEFDLNDRMNYSNDAIVGTIAEPYIFSRGTTGIGEASLSEVNIYPNPTTTGTEINLQATCDKVEVFNALGVKVAEYHNVDSIDAFETAGIYVIRLTSNGDVKHCRLIVK